MLCYGIYGPVETYAAAGRTCLNATNLHSALWANLSYRGMTPPSETCHQSQLRPIPHLHWARVCIQQAIHTLLVGNNYHRRREAPYRTVVERTKFTRVQRGDDAEEVAEAWLDSQFLFLSGSKWQSNKADQWDEKAPSDSPLLGLKRSGCTVNRHNHKRAEWLLLHAIWATCMWGRKRISVLFFPSGQIWGRGVG
jgi:hypothetical protein